MKKEWESRGEGRNKRERGEREKDRGRRGREIVRYMEYNIYLDIVIVSTFSFTHDNLTEWEKKECLISILITFQPR